MNLVPKLRKEKKVTNIHQDELIDEYAWIKQEDWQSVLKDPSKLNKEVLEYINNENNYKSVKFRDLDTFKKKIFEELKGRIKDKDSSVPIKDGQFSYYSKYMENSEYPQFLRVNKKNDEEIIFDANIKSKSFKFFNLNSVSHSYNHQYLAYNVDTNGSEYYDLSVEEISTKKIITQKIENTTGEIVWHPNNNIIFYTALDTNHRPNKIFAHKIGSDPKDDMLIYEEKDAAYFCSPSISQSKKYFFIRTGDHETSEYWFSPIENFENIKCFRARKEKEEYEIDHANDLFYILNNLDQCKNFKISITSDYNIEKWKDFIEYNPKNLLLDFTVLKKWFILLQRVNGLNQILIKNLENLEEHLIKFDDETYELSLSGQYEFDTDLIRISYSSPVTPSTIYDYDCNLKQKIHRKTQEIPSGHNSKDYICRRVMVAGHDQEAIPLTIFYHKNTKLDGKAPLLLYGYGSYGITIPDSFSSNRFSLINRGFVYAVAHIRGGREKGQEWYEKGKLMSKKNTFLDFISCAEYLCQKNYTSKGKIIAQGGSAGGLLMGYISNERPDLFLGIIAQVPFVDICNTMLDEDLPLTVTEIPEWGDMKNDQEAFKYIKSYSPYDNVKKQNYPNMLITGGITDPRVTYWEMTKWIAKLRDFKTDKNLIVLDMNMDAGHSGASGRYDYLNEVALTYIFALKISKKISP
ncbi:MAG: S9 family peptidase [Candidatus Pelagibacter sp.]|nr:S9 family peptidase [Candidatus Pelagibacter sp.]OUV86967.1 MAG: S9 family peptidase [Pelagibacteraceae bacterium TMED136]|tara:strand:+ start:10286 stop:12355 length:2070 start_codon:yes stop_codon:yes gene_type:complete